MLRFSLRNLISIASKDSNSFRIRYFSTEQPDIVPRRKWALGKFEMFQINKFE